MSEPKRLSDQFRDDCEAVFGTEIGSRVLHYLAWYTGVAESLYGPGKSHDQMAFDDGMRSLVLMMMENADPEMRLNIEKLNKTRTVPYEPMMEETTDG